MNNILGLNLNYFTVLIFLFIIFISLMKLIFNKDTEEKNFQKIIGGLSIFIIAIIIEDPWVAFISLFIGGLIIASEKFLKSLAAIMRTSGEAMPGTLAALSEDTQFKPASADEISSSDTQETEIEESIQPINSTENLLANDQKNIEKKILDNLSRKYGSYFTEKIKVDNQYGQIIVDGVIHLPEHSNSLVLENILTLVEIKYIRNSERNFLIEYTVRRVLERIRYFFIRKQVLVVFYLKDIDEERIKELDKRLTKLFNAQDNKEVTFGFIRFNEEKDLDLIFLPELNNNIVV